MAKKTPPSMTVKTVVGAYDQIDAMTDKAVEEFGPAACSTCRKPTCCWQKVDAYDSEMKQVARAIEDNEPAKARVRQWAQSFVLLPRAVQVAAGAYFRLHRPCPFLVAGRCSIYAIRPVACRTHFSFSESPRDCDPDEVGHGYPVKNLDVAHVNRALLGMEPLIERDTLCIRPGRQVARTMLNHHRPGEMKQPLSFRFSALVPACTGRSGTGCEAGQYGCDRCRVCHNDSFLEVTRVDPSVSALASAAASCLSVRVLPAHQPMLSMLLRPNEVLPQHSKTR